MALNPMLILGGQSPDLAGGIMNADAQGFNQGQRNRENALQAFQRDQGAAMLGGDRAALDQFAQFDPAGAFAFRGQVEGREQAIAARRAAAARAQAASVSAADRAKIEQALRVGDELIQQGPEAFNAGMAQLGISDQLNELGITSENYAQWSPVIRANFDMALPPQEFVTLGPNSSRVPDNQPVTAQPAQARETSSAEKIRLLMSQGATEEQAVNIAAGRWVVSRNPETNQSVIIDKATGQQVGGGDQNGQPELAAPTETPPATSIPSIDYSAAFGAPAVIGNTANAVTDFMGLGQVAPVAADATRILENLQNQTILVLSQSMSGRDTNQVRELITNMTVAPSQFGGGVADAQNRTFAMQRLLAEQLSNQNDIINGANTPAQIQAARVNARNLQGLINSYGVLGESIGGQQTGQQITQTPPNVQAVISSPEFMQQIETSGADVSAEQVWEFLPDDIKARWLQRIGGQQ